MNHVGVHWRARYAGPTGRMVDAQRRWTGVPGRPTDVQAPVCPARPPFARDLTNKDKVIDCTLKNSKLILLYMNSLENQNYNFNKRKTVTDTKLLSLPSDGSSTVLDGPSSLLMLSVWSDKKQ